MAEIRNDQLNITTDFNIGNNKLINVTDPTASQDAATKIYVDTEVSNSLESSSFSFTASGDEIPIGNPDDGTYTDGFFAFTSSTLISNAIDDISEAFLDLAPAKAGFLSGQDITLTSPTIFSGKLANGLSSDWYINFDFGDTITTLTAQTTVDLDSPDSATRFHVGNKRDFTPVNNLEGGVSASRILGDNGSWSVEGKYPYSSNTGSSGMIELTDLVEYNTFWVKANARINDTLSAQGSYQYKISATGDNGETTTYQLFYVGTGGQFPAQSFGSGPNDVFVSETTMSLSGVDYYDSGTQFRIQYSANNMYEPVYATGNQSYISSTYFANQVENYSGVPLNDAVLNVDETITLISGVSSQYDNIGTATVTLYKPNKSNVASNTNLGTRAINGINQVSTMTNDTFYDEAYRDESDTVDDWISQVTLVDGNLQVQNGRLINGKFGEYGGFTATEQSYYRKLIPSGETARINGTITLDRDGFSDFIEPWDVTSSELQVIFRANGNIYDLGRAVGDDTGSVYGIRDSISGEQITWALPVGDVVSGSNPFKMEIKFRNETSNDFVNEVTMVFN